MDGTNVTLTVGFLLRFLSANSAHVLRFLATFVFQVAFQTALVLIAPVALVAKVSIYVI